jgi:hypothetical protein
MAIKEQTVGDLWPILWIQNSDRSNHLTFPPEADLPMADNREKDKWKEKFS